MSSQSTARRSGLPALGRSLPLLLLLLFLVAPNGAWRVGASKTFAADGRIAQSIEVDIEAAIEDLPNTGWYDPRQQQYRPPSIEPTKDDPIRREGWPAKRKSGNQPPAASTGGTSSSFASDVFSAIVISLLAILLVTVIALLVYYSLQNFSPADQRLAIAHSIAIDTARVEQLPFEASRADYDAPLELAERLVAQGDLRQAVIVLYGYTLLALDQCGRIELHRGKTNRMYLQELESHEQLRKIVAGIMHAFEDVFFGEHSISAERFHELWERLPEFHALLRSQSVAVELPPVSPEASHA